MRIGKTVLLFGYLYLMDLAAHAVFDFFCIKSTENTLALIEHVWLASVFVCLVILDRRMYERGEKAGHQLGRYLVQWFVSTAVFTWTVCGRIPLNYYIHVYATAGAVAGILLLVTFFYLHKNPEARSVHVQDLLALFLAIFGCLYFGERLYSADVGLRFDYLLVNMLILFLVAWILFGVTGSWNVTLAFGAVLWMVWSLAHEYVYEFRGEVFQPADLFAINTAATVADQYVFRLSKEIWWLGVFVLVCCMVAVCGRTVRFQKAGVVRTFARMASPIIIVCLLYQSDWLSLMDYSVDVWDMKGLYDTLGYTFGFVKTWKESEVHVPDGYSEDTVAKLAEQYQTMSSQVTTETPDIIVIMNETLADLSDVGELNCNQDYMPYIHSCDLEENTKTGRVLVSVFGGHTCDSEYEFLTGNSLEYMSAIVPYATEISKDTYSLASTLEQQGYQTIATHPNEATNWRRDKVYQCFGFDESYFIDDYEDSELIRGWCTSDRDVYQKVTSLLDSGEVDQPKFVFAVTMQNHGGYTGVQLRADEKLAIEEEQIGSAALNEYLSLIYESDTAFEELIREVDQRERPTIVVMFGDHMPNLGDDVYNALRGGSAYGLADTQTMYATPYVIHANYDIDLESVADYMSINYLSSNLLRVAGLKTTAYNNYLLDMQTVIPALNRNGYLTVSGEWKEYSDEDASAEGDRIKEYNMLEYNARYKEAAEEMFAVEEE